MFGRGHFGYQAKQVVYNVYKYHKTRKMCKDSEEYLSDINLAQKVADITGLSKARVQKIITDGNNMEIENGNIDFKPKDKIQEKRRIVIDNIVEGIIRRKAIKYTNIRKVQEVLQKENILFCSKETIRRTLNKLGFTRYKSVRLSEAIEIMNARKNYLTAVKYLREQERSIFYLSETKRWKGESDDNPKIEEIPTYVMIHSSGTLGFLDKANLIMKMQLYDERFEHFENYEWVKDVVLRNLPSNSVIIMNIPYCETPESIIQDVKPTDTSRTSLESWLNRHNIQFNKNDPVSELLELINSQDSKMEYSISKILKESGHEVLYIPENHHDLDPAAIMWHDIKNGVENVSYVQMANALFTNYTPEKLEECLDYVKENEAEYHSYHSMTIQKEDNIE